MAILGPCLKSRSKRFLAVHLALIFIMTAADTITLCTCDSKRVEEASHDNDRYIYRNHVLFYWAHTAGEVCSLAYIVAVRLGLLS